MDRTVHVLLHLDSGIVQDVVVFRSLQDAEREFERRQAELKLPRDRDWILSASNDDEDLYIREAVLR